MGKTEKKFNKRLIGAVIGSAVIGGLSMTPKGKSRWRRSLDKVGGVSTFLKGGIKEIKKTRKEIRNQK